MATAISWSGLETIEGIIHGQVVPEALPFASLDVDTQATIIDEIDDICLDISSAVTDKYPDLDDEAPAFFQFMLHNQPPAGGNVVAVMKGGKPVW